MGDRRNTSGMSGSQTDGMASLQVAQKPQQQADDMGICVAKRTRRGSWKVRRRGTRLGKEQPRAGKSIHELTKKQALPEKSLGWAERR